MGDTTTSCAQASMDRLIGLCNSDTWVSIMKCIERKACIISYPSTMLECLENAKKLAKNNELIILATTRSSSSIIIHLNLTPAHHPSSSIDLFHRLFNEPSVLRIEHLLRPVSASTFVINFSPSDDQPLLG